jgi:hypothetical protein
MEGSAPSEIKEETAHRLIIRDKGVPPATLRIFASTDWKRRNGGMLVGHSGRIALRREQCSV